MNNEKTTESLPEHVIGTGPIFGAPMGALFGLQCILSACSRRQVKAEIKAKEENGNET